MRAWLSTTPRAVVWSLATIAATSTAPIAATVATATAPQVTFARDGGERVESVSSASPSRVGIAHV